MGGTEEKKGSGEATPPDTEENSDYCKNTGRVTSPIQFDIPPGKFLHDYDSKNEKTLQHFANKLKAMSVFDIFFDYTRVISMDAKQTAHEFSKHEELNRYQDIRCPDSTRVKVPNPTNEHDYIHANYCDGFREEKKFILTQAPLFSTVEQFWAMIWQECCTTIVAVTVLDSTTMAVYLPFRSGDHVNFGPYRIVNGGTRHVRDAYDATILFVTKGESPARQLLHLAYYSWPDKGTPTRPTEVLNFIEDMNFNQKKLVAEGKKRGWIQNNSHSPIVIHCLAGVGRSGALAALDICQRKLDYTMGKETGPCVDVRDTVLRIRSQREMAVQKPEQYVFLHLSIMEYALRKRYFESIDNLDVSKLMGNKE
uniref:Protein tyrosine phosphatase n=1 Tax=Panagrolaimus sp. JU765 TaxID=591449 RepID=A0AC34R3V8_9BILA